MIMIIFIKKDILMEISNIGNIKKSEIDLYRLITKKIDKFEEYEIEYIKNENDIKKNIKDILEVTRESFSEDSYLFLESNMNLILSEEEMNTIIIKHKGYLVGYLCYQFKRNHRRLAETVYYNESMGYISMCVIRPKYQGKGLYNLGTYLMLNNLMELGANKIFVRTQNIKVFLGIKKMLNNLKTHNKIKCEELEFIKHEKNIFKGEVSSVSNLLEEKPIEMENLDIKNGDIGLYLWNIKI